MVKYLIVIAVIIFVCVFLNKISSRVGVPVLLLFIFLGMLFGYHEQFNPGTTANVETMCSIALIFIMFYGGFGTRWDSAKPVVVEAGLLATAGVFITAAAVGLFCRFALQWDWVESFLMGSVISSTDAATVFSILRSHKMGLKNNTAPMIEIESGSNDPCSYMLTVVMLAVLNGTASGGMVVGMIFKQLIFGAICGLAIAQGAVAILQRFRLPDGFSSLFILAVSILGYAFPSAIGGNGYLSTYIVGIVLGNTDFHGRKPLIGFFDGVTSLMQIMLFFILGLMAAKMPLLESVIPAVAVFLFLSLIARPLAVGSILLPFKKYPAKQIGLVSFVGLRGVASIVFAIMTINAGAILDHDIFSVVFVIVLISILLQGSLIPWASKAFKMTDNNQDIMSTFSDYSEKAEVSFGRIEIDQDSPWNNKRIMELGLPKEMLVSMIIRGKENIIPKGHTVLLSGDKVIFCSKSYQNETEANLKEHRISKNSSWIGKRIKDHPDHSKSLIVMIKRGDSTIIPDGDTILQKGDILVILEHSQQS